MTDARGFVTVPVMPVIRIVPMIEHNPVSSQTVRETVQEVLRAVNVWMYSESTISESTISEP